ncbi:hypothetical protein VPHK406_0010 [Vibrio phage K406]
MVEEILAWWKECIRTGSVCCAKHSYYLTKHTLAYNEAMRIYNKEEFDKKFPEIRRIK